MGVRVAYSSFLLGWAVRLPVVLRPLCRHAPGDLDVRLVGRDREALVHPLAAISALMPVVKGRSSYVTSVQPPHRAWQRDRGVVARVRPHLAAKGDRGFLAVGLIEHGQAASAVQSCAISCRLSGPTCSMSCPCASKTSRPVPSVTVPPPGTVNSVFDPVEKNSPVVRS